MGQLPAPMNLSQSNISLFDVFFESLIDTDFPLSLFYDFYSC